MRRTLLLVLLAPWLLGAGRAPVAPGVELHYVEAGEGPPLVFVPGWTLTTELFEAQLDAFADRHRVVAFDPRSHGRSTKTSEGNTYMQQGRDLAALLDHLELDDVVLVGWSSGGHTVLSSIRETGLEGLRAVVLVDEPPKAVGDPSSEWVWGAYEGYRSTFRSILYERRESAAGLARWMVGRDLSDEEVDWIVAESLRTPAEAALALMVDTTLLDYSPEARLLDGKVPVLYMVREEWAESAGSWLRENAPAAELVTLESHAEHWEAPERFNAKLERFLSCLDEGRGQDGPACDTGRQGRDRRP